MIDDKFKIIINEESIALGKLSISRILDKTDEDNPQIKIKGLFSTHKYYEDIFTLETERYRIEGIEVIREDFGSTSFDIVYTFEATDLKIIGGESFLEDEDIQRKEEIIYGGENVK